MSGEAPRYPASCVRCVTDSRDQEGYHRSSRGSLTPNQKWRTTSRGALCCRAWWLLPNRLSRGRPALSPRAPATSVRVGVHQRHAGHLEGSSGTFRYPHLTRAPSSIRFLSAALLEDCSPRTVADSL